MGRYIRHNWANMPLEEMTGNEIRRKYSITNKYVKVINFSGFRIHVLDLFSNPSAQCSIAAHDSLMLIARNKCSFNKLYGNPKECHNQNNAASPKNQEEEKHFEKKPQDSRKSALPSTTEIIKSAKAYI